MSDKEIIYKTLFLYAKLLCHETTIILGYCYRGIAIDSVAAHDNTLRSRCGKCLRASRARRSLFPYRIIMLSIIDIVFDYDRSMTIVSVSVPATVTVSIIVTVFITITGSRYFCGLPSRREYLLRSRVYRTEETLPVEIHIYSSIYRLICMWGTGLTESRSCDRG